MKKYIIALKTSEYSIYHMYNIYIIYFRVWIIPSDFNHMRYYFQDSLLDEQDSYRSDYI